MDGERFKIKLHVKVTLSDPGLLADGAEESGFRSGETLGYLVSEAKLLSKGMVVLAVDGLQIRVPAQRKHPAPPPSAQPGRVTVPVDKTMEVRAAAIQVDPGPWDAYVLSTAGSGSLREITLSWKAGGKKGGLTDQDYPYEFSVPVAAGETEFALRPAESVPVDRPSKPGKQSLGSARDRKRQPPFPRPPVRPNGCLRGLPPKANS